MHTIGVAPVRPPENHKSINFQYTCVILSTENMLQEGAMALYLTLFVQSLPTGYKEIPEKVFTYHSKWLFGCLCVWLSINLRPSNTQGLRFFLL